MKKPPPGMPVQGDGPRHQRYGEEFVLSHRPFETWAVGLPNRLVTGERPARPVALWRRGGVEATSPTREPPRKRENFLRRTYRSRSATIGHRLPACRRRPARRR